MEYTTHLLWEQIGHTPGVIEQAIADRIWTDLVSVLMHSGASMEQNRQALHFLTKLTSEDAVASYALRKSILIEASKWLSTL